MADPIATVSCTYSDIYDPWCEGCWKRFPTFELRAVHEAACPAFQLMRVQEVIDAQAIDDLDRAAREAGDFLDRQEVEAEKRWERLFS